MPTQPALKFDAAPRSFEMGGKALKCGSSLARLTTGKLDARCAAGETLDKIASPPIT